ncbi:prolyl oligopeptidase family serine peptidase [Flavobacterium sp. RHBU_24]|uniref:S9 family peptidase n=1 Tax=Flavobacterium sp. RHBU_24 TaxID=3391185 RepID=UPI0039846F63
MGQGNIKIPLTPAQYPQFGTLWPQKISPKGNWASYAIQYESGMDTLFVRHEKGSPAYSFPSGREGYFNGDSAFLCLVADKLIIQDLKTGTAKAIAGVARYRIIADGNMAVFHSINDGGETLTIYNSLGLPLREFGKVTAVGFNDSTDKMVYCSNDGHVSRMCIAALTGRLTNELLISGPSAGFSHPVWKKETIAFTSLGPAAVLYSYNTKSKLLKSYPGITGSAGGMKLSGEYGSLYISGDQKRIFFHLIENDMVKQEGGVQVWNSLDRQLYPNRQRYGDQARKNKIAVWDLERNDTAQLTDSQYQFETLNGAADKLIASTVSNKPSLHLQHESKNIWVTDISSGVRREILTENPVTLQSIIASPGGRYISYTDGHNWWLYNLFSGTSKNITKEIPFPVFNEAHNKPSSPELYGSAGWVKGDRAMLVYDRFDIWEISPSDGVPVRLTFGRERGYSYRVVQGQPELSGYEFSNNIARSVDLEKGLMLQVTDVENQVIGYSLLNGDGKMIPLVKPLSKTSHLYKAAIADKYIYMEQDFDIPRQLMHLSMPGGKRKTIFKSNPQQEKYLWGRSEKISFNYNGRTLSAALYYPANFVSAKMYPMIVQVYERQSPYVHEFTNPSYLEQGGFNITNYTANGYFVLLPDIGYEIGNTGNSATGSVNAAVDAVLAHGHVSADKVGLIGHSFGGFETAIIITNTDRFAAAVSGSAWTDLVSGYFSIGKNTMTADFWRYEQDQLRLGKSPYEDIVPYIDNSPVLRADAVNTPLLSWAGLQDETINPYQSIEFHLALRRLGKINTLLLYPTEPHMLLEPLNQEDLSKRIEQWFGHYLKGEPAQGWMMPR